MSTIKKIEDFQVWVESMRLSRLLQEVIDLLPKSEEYNIKKHLSEGRRNIPANIAEGFGRFYYKESVQFYRIAQGSLNEAKTDIYLCYMGKHIDKELFHRTINQMDTVGKMISGCILSAKLIKKIS